MGIGGNLMWTPLAYEIYKKTGKISVFVKNTKNGKIIINDKIGLWKNLDFIFDNEFNLTYNDVFNDPKYFLIDMDLRPDLNNKKQPNISNHIIINRCAYFHCFYPRLKTYMNFNDEEYNYIKKIISELPPKFIIIEPHAKTSWCEHKQYPIEKWQKVIDNLYKNIPFVQMSLPDNLVMKNVINVGNKVRNFRDCALLLKYACLFVGTEGGFMHAAQVHNTKCVCLFSPMFDPKWTKYPDDDSLWVYKGNHRNCFIQGTCNRCLKAMNNYDYKKIVNKIKKKLKISN